MILYLLRYLSEKHPPLYSLEFRWSEYVTDYSDVPVSHAGFLSMVMAGLTAKPWLNAMHFALTRQPIITAMANNNKIKPLLALIAACQATGISLQALSDQLFME